MQLLWVMYRLCGGSYRVTHTNGHKQVSKWRTTSITFLKQYSLLSLVNTYHNVSKYQKHENGHLEKKMRAEYCWCCWSHTF